jgi:hypothetical protein
MTTISTLKYNVGVSCGILVFGYAIQMHRLCSIQFYVAVWIKDWIWLEKRRLCPILRKYLQENAEKTEDLKTIGLQTDVGTMVLSSRKQRCHLWFP